MKCNHCGSEWNSTTMVKECPFCHKSLTPPTGEPLTLVSVLVQVREQLGTQALGNGRMLIGAFRDLAPTLKKDCILLTHMEQCGGINALFQARTSSEAEQTIEMSKVVSQMTDELAIDKNAAEHVCSAYLKVITGREQEPAQKQNDSRPYPEPIQKQMGLTLFQEQLIKKLKEAEASQKIPEPQLKPVNTPSKPPILEIINDGTLEKYVSLDAVVTIPADVRIIAENVFKDNTRLTTVHLPAGLEQIKRGAFWGCKNLKEISFPGSIKAIDPFSFCSCSNLERVTFQEGITKLGHGAFSSCYNIKHLHLPHSLKDVHPDAFEDLKNTEVHGNTAWMVKDGHLIAKPKSTSAAQNQSINVDVRNSAANTRMPQNERPTSADVPPVTKSSPPKSPRKNSENKLVAFFARFMWPIWCLGFLISFFATKDLNTDGSFFFAIPIVLLFLGIGRFLAKNEHYKSSVLLLFLAVSFVVMFYTELPIPTVAAGVLQWTIAAICIISAICHGIRARYK